MWITYDDIFSSIVPNGQMFVLFLFSLSAMMFIDNFQEKSSLLFEILVFIWIYFTKIFLRLMFLFFDWENNTDVSSLSNSDQSDWFNDQQEKCCLRSFSFVSHWLIFLRIGILIVNDSGSSQDRENIDRNQYWFNSSQVNVLMFSIRFIFIQWNMNRIENESSWNEYRNQTS